MQGNAVTTHATYRKQIVLLSTKAACEILMYIIKQNTKYYLKKYPEYRMYLSCLGT